MNRALPALILLLGTLGGSIVALGVARDLERVSRRPTTLADQAATAEEPSTPFAAVRTTPNVVIRSVSLNRQVWETVPPLRYEAEPDWAAESLAAVKQLLRGHKKLLASLPVKTCRVVDREFAKVLAAAKSSDTQGVDALIAQNDGVLEKAELYVVPYGYVAVGAERKLVKIQHRGGVAEASSLWTGVLHYGSEPHRTLDSTIVTTLPTAHRAAPLPWDKQLLWSADREAAVAALNRTAAQLASLAPASLDGVNQAIEWLAWTDRQVDRGWAGLTTRVKRELWLATVSRAPASLLRSAELPQGEKR